MAVEGVVETDKVGVEEDLVVAEDLDMEVVVEVAAGEVQLECVLRVQEEIMEEVPLMIGGEIKRLVKIRSMVPCVC